MRYLDREHANAKFQWSLRRGTDFTNSATMESSVREPKWELVIQEWNLNTYFAQKDQKREIRKLLYGPKVKKRYW